MTKIRILISIAMLLFGFNASSSGAIVYGNVAIAYGAIELTATGMPLNLAVGSATFPIDFAGVPVVTLTGVGSECRSFPIVVTSVSPTSVQVETIQFVEVGGCVTANYTAIGKI